MKYPFAAVLLCFGLLCGCRPQRVEPAKSRASLSGTTEPATNDNSCWIEATLDQKVFKVGQPITVHLVMRLVGRHVYLAKDAFFHFFEADVISPDGKVMSFSTPGATYYEDHTGGMRTIVQSDYGYTDDYDFPLEKLYNFSAPGRYRASFSHSVCVARGGSASQPTDQSVRHLSSDVISFQIVP